MPYGTSNIRNHNNKENFDRHLKIEKPLDSDHRPVKIGEKQTGLQLADKDVKVENDLIVNKDINVLGEIKASPIILDSNNGKFLAKNNGTEFSVADSSYAGMVIGYTCIGLDEAAATYNLTTSYAVPTNDLTIKFVAPPSGKVEIEMQIGWDAGSSNAGDLYAGLSDANATSGYNRLQDYHEVELFDAMSRGALRCIRHSWVLTGLTAGTAYQYWVGFKSVSTIGTPHLQWGGNASGEYPDFIMKATALPSTITT